MDISRSRHSESALQCRRQVGDDIAEHVVGHNHLKIFGLANHKQTKRIYIKVAGLNPRVPGGGLLEAALPQVSGIGQHIRFVAHADRRFPVVARIIESVFNDAVHALAGVDLYLVRHFIGSSLLEDTAGIHVSALGVLTDDGKVHVVNPHSLEWAQALVEQTHRPDVRVQIQTESQREQDLGGMTLIRDTRIAHRSEQNRLEILAKHFKRARWQRNAFFQVFLSAPIELDEFQPRAEYFIDTTQHAHGLASDVNPDPVSGNYCDSLHGLTKFERNSSHTKAHEPQKAFATLVPLGASISF